MTEAQHLSDALSRLFTTKNAGWFLPFNAAVAGLTAEQAAKVPAPGFNSVWVVVNHINFWQQVMLNRLRDIPVDRSALSAGQGWEQPADPTDEAAWSDACERALQLNKELAALVAALPNEGLDCSIETWNETRAQAIHGLIAHNTYHICEIISIRHMNGFWLEKT